MNFISKIGSFAACISVLLALGACRNNKNFPDKPYLEYRNASMVNAASDPDFPLDHALVELYFTDGDGNIGIDPPPPGEFNFIVSVFERIDSQYVYAYDWSGILKDLADEGRQNRVLEGEIRYKIGLADVSSDSVYFEFELLDDDGNSSGVIVSERLYVPF